MVQGADITTTDPFQIQAIRGMHMSMYDQLVIRDANFKIAPWLATSWTNPDDMTWIFKLRPGVKFHNGEPFNAASVIWSFQRFVAPEEKNIYASMLAPVGEITAVDDYTVKMVTKAPFPALLENLAYGVFMGLHRDGIALLGMVLGELFDLESLAEDCAREDVYDCLFSAKPLNLRGGVGSPANALAMK